MIRALSFVLAFAALAAAQNDPENQTPQLSQTVDGVTMQLVGNSGQIKLFPASDSNRFIRIRMSTLTEVDASGSAVPGPRNSINFASLHKAIGARVVRPAASNLDRWHSVLLVDFHLQRHSSVRQQFGNLQTQS